MNGYFVTCESFRFSQQCVDEDLVPLACEAGSLVRWFPTFRDYLVVSLFFSGIPIVENFDIATETLCRNVGNGIPRFLSQCNGNFLLLFLPQYCSSVCYV